MGRLIPPAVPYNVQIPQLGDIAGEFPDPRNLLHRVLEQFPRGL